ncbi:unnamed protein product [Dracunculus medinensis]|uniref:DOMON domain-containing protein n=1 Tax=Dracunculus medinensis TaxID=318479 RepID=A0A0N4U9U3_DRAME|nr:unnamed protein product [Dracunculus medinensis]
MKPLVLAFLVVVIQDGLCVCRFEQNAYILSWILDNENNIYFQLNYTKYPLRTNAWTGVAFGETMLSGLDAIIVRIIGDRITVKDESVRGYGPTVVDQKQNIRLNRVLFSNAVLSVDFSRPLKTDDAWSDHPLDGCHPWQFFPFLSALHDDGTTGKHIRAPHSRIICISRCRS